MMNAEKFHSQIKPQDQATMGPSWEPAELGVHDAPELIVPQIVCLKIGLKIFKWHRIQSTIAAVTQEPFEPSM